MMYSIVSYYLLTFMPWSAIELEGVSEDMCFDDKGMYRVSTQYTYPVVEGIIDLIKSNDRNVIR